MLMAVPHPMCACSPAPPNPPSPRKGGGVPPFTQDRQPVGPHLHGVGTLRQGTFAIRDVIARQSESLTTTTQSVPHLSASAV
jgi:hypothetical protein